MDHPYQNDLEFSNYICNKNNINDNNHNRAKKIIQKQYYKLLLSISHKYVHYQSDKYNPIEDYDDVLNTYEWLSLKLIKLCCKYNNMDTKLDIFLKASLYNKYTKIEWCKYSFKKKYKVEEYVPVCIQKLDDNYIALFKLLFRRKSEKDICNKINIDKETYDLMEIEIKKILTQNGKDYLLNDYINKFSKIDKALNETDDSLSIEEQNEVKQIKYILDESIKAINPSYRRLLMMYWGAGMNAKQIINLINTSKFSTKLENIDIQDNHDLYNYIATIISEIKHLIKNNYSDYFIYNNENNLTDSKLKQTIKLYFHYIYDNQKDSNEYEFYSLLRSNIMN